MPPSISTRIPPLLHPYIRLTKDESILLLTSTLGASANWLIIRFLCDALNAQPQRGDGDGSGEAIPGSGSDTRVILVSWLREYEFWRAEARKGAGVDLERARREGRFAFVDGLSGLFGGDQSAGASPGAQVAPPTSRSLPTRAPQTLPVRGPPPPAAAAVGRTIQARGPSTQTNAPSPTPAPQPTIQQGIYTLTSPALPHLKSTLQTALTSPSPPPKKTLLILDNPDALLALDPSLTPASLSSLLLSLHASSISHMLVHMQSDNPLLSPSAPVPQPLELAQHDFLVRIAHASSRILGVRVLDTGVARDVSGVVRVTRAAGGGFAGGLGLGLGEEEEEEEGLWGENGSGKEFLYQVRGDGGVRVFERGAGGEG
ncbi:hypothetical protein BS50DRAFT_662171 [Corynespora cassiicola Philippines]|uniref:Elongator complex protein 6 n=1 Tax=Corynespora cassiicola Philippines TaxID=1448308 RepID=A0A2T2NXD5_CORCC|nr:hypothetical protein BS50DRAFT_662171 [Corynespora cassiicola Philippines]